MKAIIWKAQKKSQKNVVFRYKAVSMVENFHWDKLTQTASNRPRGVIDSILKRYRGLIF